VELARLLAAQAAAGGGEHDRLEAGLEMLGAVRALLKRGRVAAAAQAAGEAISLGLALPLSPRERLRLGGAAEAAGDADAAVTLLRALTEETPDAPEDEMARLKLGQLLRGRDPQAARAVLASFLEKYPHSEWVRRARELQTYV
jgi:TolA-binding protein